MTAYLAMQYSKHISVVDMQVLDLFVVVMSPDGLANIEGQLQNLEEHYHGDADVEAQRSAQAGHKAFALYIMKTQTSNSRAQ